MESNNNNQQGQQQQQQNQHQPRNAAVLEEPDHGGNHITNDPVVVSRRRNSHHQQQQEVLLQQCINVDVDDIDEDGDMMTISNCNSSRGHADQKRSASASASAYTMPTPASLLKRPQQDRDTRWNNMYEKLVAFYKRHGDLCVRRDLSRNTDDAGRLYSWLGNQKKFYQQRLNGIATPLTDDRVEKLDRLGFSTAFATTTATAEIAATATASVEPVKVAAPRPSNDTITSVQTDSSSSSSDLFCPSKSDSEQSEQPDPSVKQPVRQATGVQPKPNAAPPSNARNLQWSAMFDQLVAFRNRNGHLRIPQNPSTNEDQRLRSWFANQQYFYSRKLKGLDTPLTDDRIERLKSIGFLETFQQPPPSHHHRTNQNLPRVGRSLTWKEGYQLLMKYFQRHGHVRMPPPRQQRGHDDGDDSNDVGPELQQWIANQRKAYRNKTMELGQYEKLKALDFSFDLPATTMKIPTTTTTAAVVPIVTNPIVGAVTRAAKKASTSQTIRKEVTTPHSINPAMAATPTSVVTITTPAMIHPTAVATTAPAVVTNPGIRTKAGKAVATSPSVMNSQNVIKPTMVATPLEVVNNPFTATMPKELNPATAKAPVVMMNPEKATAPVEYAMTATPLMNPVTATVPAVINAVPAATSLEVMNPVIAAAVVPSAVNPETAATAPVLSSLALQNPTSLSHERDLTRPQQLQHGSKSNALPSKAADPNIPSIQQPLDMARMEIRKAPIQAHVGSDFRSSTDRPTPPTAATAMNDVLSLSDMDVSESESSSRRTAGTDDSNSSLDEEMRQLEEQLLEDLEMDILAAEEKEFLDALELDVTIAEERLWYEQQLGRPVGILTDPDPEDTTWKPNRHRTRHPDTLIDCEEVASLRKGAAIVPKHLNNNSETVLITREELDSITNQLLQKIPFDKRVGFFVRLDEIPHETNSCRLVVGCHQDVWDTVWNFLRVFCTAKVNEFNYKMLLQTGVEVVLQLDRSAGLGVVLSALGNDVNGLLMKSITSHTGELAKALGIKKVPMPFGAAVVALDGEPCLSIDDFKQIKGREEISSYKLTLRISESFDLSHLNMSMVHQGPTYCHNEQAANGGNVVLACNISSNFSNINQQVHDEAEFGDKSSAGTTRSNSNFSSLNLQEVHGSFETANAVQGGHDRSISKLQQGPTDVLGSTDEINSMPADPRSRFGAVDQKVEGSSKTTRIVQGENDKGQTRDRPSDAVEEALTEYPQDSIPQEEEIHMNLPQDVILGFPQDGTLQEEGMQLNLPQDAMHQGGKAREHDVDGKGGVLDAAADTAKQFRSFRNLVSAFAKEEFGVEGIQATFVIGSMWRRHKYKFGNKCDDACPCFRNLPFLTKNVVKDYIKKHPDWSASSGQKATEYPVGITGSFASNFVELLCEEYPSEGRTQIMTRLYKMWEVHRRNITFGIKCGPKCNCADAWEEVFSKGNPRKRKALIDSRISKKRRVVDTSDQDTIPPASMPSENIASLHNVKSSAVPIGRKTKVPRKSSVVEIATPKAAQQEPKQQKEYSVEFSAKEPLGFFCRTSFDSGQRCFVLSVYPQGQCRKDARIQKNSTVVGASYTENIEDRQELTSHEGLRSAYDSARHNRSRFFIWFINSRVTAKSVSVTTNPVRADWTQDGHWRGSKMNGWDGRTLSSDESTQAERLAVQGTRSSSEGNQSLTVRVAREAEIAEATDAWTVIDYMAPLPSPSYQPKSIRRWDKDKARAVSRNVRFADEHETRRYDVDSRTCEFHVPSGSSLSTRVSVQDDPNRIIPNGRDRLIGAIQNGTYEDLLGHLEDGVLADAFSVDDLIASMRTAVKERKETLKSATMSSDVVRCLEDLDRKDTILKVYAHANHSADMTRSLKYWNIFEITILEVDLIEFEKSFQESALARGGDVYGSVFVDFEKEKETKAWGVLKAMPFSRTIIYDPPMNLTPVKHNRMTATRSIKINLIFEGIDGEHKDLSTTAIALQDIHQKCPNLKEKKDMVFDLDESEILLKGRVTIQARRLALETQEIDQKRTREKGRINEVSDWIDRFNKSIGQVEGSTQRLISADVKVKDNVTLLQSAILLKDDVLVDKLLWLGANPATKSALGTALSLAQNMRDAMGEGTKEGDKQRGLEDARQKAHRDRLSRIVSNLRRHLDYFGETNTKQTGEEEQVTSASAGLPQIHNFAHDSKFAAQNTHGHYGPNATTVEWGESGHYGPSTERLSYAAGSALSSAQAGQDMATGNYRKRGPSISDEAVEEGPAKKRPATVLAPKVSQITRANLLSLVSNKKPCWYFGEQGYCKFDSSKCRNLHIARPVGEVKMASFWAAGRPSHPGSQFSREIKSMTAQNWDSDTRYSVVYQDPTTKMVYFPEAGPGGEQSAQYLWWYSTLEEAEIALYASIAVALGS